MEVPGPAGSAGCRGDVEPLSFNWPESAQIIGGVVILVLNVPVLLVVFEEQWERGVAFCLLTLLFAANIVHEV